MRTQVLIVDDEPAVLRIYPQALSKADIGFDVAATIAMATDKLTNHRYDVLIVDNKLLDGDGLSLVQRLRQGDFGTLAVNTRAILLTGGNYGNDVEELADDLRVRIVHKPLLPKDLLSLIQHT
jgi:DNA-binding response OmpR family regulator